MATGDGEHAITHVANYKLQSDRTPFFGFPQGEPRTVPWVTLPIRRSPMSDRNDGGGLPARAMEDYHPALAL